MATFNYVIKIDDKFRLFEDFSQTVLNVILLEENYHIFNNLIYTTTHKNILSVNQNNKNEIESKFERLINLLNRYNTKIESLFLNIDTAYVYGLMFSANKENGFVGSNLLNYFLVEIEEERADEFEKFFDDSIGNIKIVETFYRRGEISSPGGVGTADNDAINTLINRSNIPTVAIHTNGSSKRQIKVLDFEQGWGLNEPGISRFNGTLIRGGGHNYTSGANHGDQTLQVLAGNPSNLNYFKGICPFANIELGSTRFNNSGEKREAALVAVLGNNRLLIEILQNNNIAVNSLDLSKSANLKQGDIVLLEMQAKKNFYCKGSTSQSTNLLPVEIEKAMFDIIQYATNSNIIIIEAAGNGKVNLDNIDLNKPLSKKPYAHFSKDSGAIIVSNEKSGSDGNTGSKVNIYMNYSIDTESDSWGDDFAGSSAASAIVAGMAAILQQTRLNQGKSPLLPSDLKTRLKNPLNFQSVLNDVRTLM
jgi:hypothetical protein